MLGVGRLSIVMLNVVMLNVAAPSYDLNLFMTLISNRHVCSCHVEIECPTNYSNTAGPWLCKKADEAGPCVIMIHVIGPQVRVVYLKLEFLRPAPTLV
jgi:hypothetical protein